MRCLSYCTQRLEIHFFPNQSNSSWRRVEALPKPRLFINTITPLKVARLSKHLRQLLQSLLIFCGEAIELRTVNVNNRYHLIEC